MQKLILGLVAGIVLTLAGVNVFRADSTQTQSGLSRPPPAVPPGHMDWASEIVYELALLRDEMAGIRARLDALPVGQVPEGGTSVQQASVEQSSDSNFRNKREENPQALAMQKQAALDRLSDFSLSLPEFMGSVEFTGLSPEVQDEVMREVARRFNAGEIDRERFVPGYVD
jgi:hypothetical protein